MLWLPDAVRDPHGRSLAFTETSDPKGCLHTTEGSGWPGYGGWTVHPHLTVMPIPGKGVTVRQHIPFDRAGFALRNLSGGVQTNTDYVFQIELIGTCYRGGPGYCWPDADDAVLLDLAVKVIVPMSRGIGIPLTALRFQAYPSSYGARSGTNDVRLSGPGFDTFSGWMGHQHAPENVHGDPGAFPWDRMIALLEDDDMDWNDELRRFGSDDPTDTQPARIWLTSGQGAAVAARDNAVAAVKAAQEAAAAAKAAAAAATAATQAAGRTEAAVRALSVGGVDVQAVAAAVIAELRAHPLTPKP